MSFANEEGAGTSQDSELINNFRPVLLLSVEEVRRLKRAEVIGVRRRRLHCCNLCPYQTCTKTN